MIIQILQFCVKQAHVVMNLLCFSIINALYSSLMPERETSRLQTLSGNS